MAKEDVVDTNQDQTQTDQTETADQSDDYKAKYETLAKEIEQIKKAQSGVDRENKKLREELQQKEKGEQTLEEKLQELQEENRRERTERMRVDVLGNADLMSAYELIKLDTTTEDGMKSFVDAYKSSVDEEVKRRVEAEIKKRFGNDKPPQGGEPEKSTYTQKEIASMSPEEFAKLDMDKIKVV